MFDNTPGLGKKHKKVILSRLELRGSPRVFLSKIPEFKHVYRRELIGFLNNYYSQVSSVNTTLYSLERLNIIRFYLIRSYRGYCHSLGKPVRGQRTWSNAWNSYNLNYVLRRFISQSRHRLDKDRLVTKVDYRMTKKKYISKKKKITTSKVKSKIWY